MKVNSLTVAIAAVLFTVPVFKSHAISSGYRAQLERSGCTQITDGNGCDIHKTKAQNAAAAKKAAKHSLTLDQISSEADSINGATVDAASDYLYARGWNHTGYGEWSKGAWKVRFIPVDGKVTQARLTK